MAKVAAANGTVVANYSQIGVLVARSTNPSFATAVSGAGVESVASTAGLGTALDEGGVTEGDVAGTVDSTVQAATGATTAEPLYGAQWDMSQIKVAEAHAVNLGSPNVVVGVLDSGSRTRKSRT